MSLHLVVESWQLQFLNVHSISFKAIQIHSHFVNINLKDCKTPDRANRQAPCCQIDILLPSPRLKAPEARDNNERSRTPSTARDFEKSCSNNNLLFTLSRSSQLAVAPLELTHHGLSSARFPYIRSCFL